MIIQVMIHNYGAVSRKGKYPKATYKVPGEYRRGPNGIEVDPLSEAGLLLANGWTLAKHKTDTYFYLTAPGGQYQRDTAVEIDVPEPETVKELAFALHAQGVEARGTLKGWPYHYEPYRKETSTVRIIGPDGSRWETRTSEHNACFNIGDYSIWGVFAGWDDGGDVPRWVCHGSLEYEAALLGEVGGV